MLTAANKQVLALGLGNTLLADDGVGVHVVRRLAADATTPPWIRAVDGGTMGFRLTSILHDADDLLIIDAADFAAAPGTIRVLDGEALAAAAARTQRTSAHEAGLADLFMLLRLEDYAPRHLAVLAIQPLTIDWGEELSAPVAKSVDSACMFVRRISTGWRCGA
jgi:hydrogenase maturation protease